MATIKTEKKDNYSSAQIAAITSAAAANGGVLNKAAATELAKLPIFKDKTEKSIIAKLSNMARSIDAPFKYERAKKQSVNGGEVTRKADVVARLEELVGFSVDSLIAGSKPQLDKLVNYVETKLAA